MTPHCLITARRRSTRTLVRIWELIRDGRNPASPSALIDLCIVDFAREVRARLASLAAELDPMEDLLIERREAGRLTDLGGLLGTARCEATRLKRELSALARAVEWLRGPVTD